MSGRHNKDAYISFHQHPLSPVEGPQSSEEGSGLHSPVFDPVIGASHQSTAQYAQQTPSIKLELAYTSSYSSLALAYPPVAAYEQPPVHPATSRMQSQASTSSDSNRSSRKELSTAVIACRQCRGRKIRCDSTRPVCNNCVRRSNVCEYDPFPKRRGPDKRPGTRQRSCKKRPPSDGSEPPPPKKKRIAREPPSAVAPSKQESMPEPKQSPVNHEPVEHLPAAQASDQVYLVEPSSSRHPYPYEQSSESGWWEEFLPAYPHVVLCTFVLLFTSTRLNEIAADLTYLFSDTGHWLSFLNLPFFLQFLSNPLDRLRIQPAFILAGLAMANLMRSSQTEYGEQGRNRALWLREAAQVKLEESWNSGWVDHMLAQAALILALFETSTHPQHHPDRIISSLNFLDGIIRRLKLTSIDAHDTDVSVFPSGTVPVVNITDTGGADDFRADRKCSCLPPDSMRPPDPHHSWTYTPPWDSTWSTVQTREEESRRVCWCALGLVAEYTAQCAAFDRKAPDLFLTDSANYALLFPGQVLDRISPNYRAVDSHSPKESVWALYCRSMLLWCFCSRFSRDPECGDEVKAEFAQEAWNETQAILDSLNLHVCNLDTGLMYMSREYVYNARMAITHALRSLQGLNTRGPVITRKQADEWIFYQEQVIKRVKLALRHITTNEGQMLTRRPYQAGWYSNQLALCLMLWNNDRSLVNALELAKSFLVPVDVMNALWPCAYNHHQCSDFRERLTDACTLVGLDPPPQCSLPPPLELSL